ncbi:hypothetical protein AWM70_07345 [Paenibacillus yonginensis]|uniref:PucR C-terminal helix-turn-helix domain-containing protein n=1 Tax=Paenibacillus yonginensis TaxID=1462996 RepID=A0A1B1MZ11_9BACL|nr:helix-turn-helix domain-containing protein [Paenibacillus yonginensis]ANS74415.1 hypothetical protein AWM70_07345 [Paenibacillus yonginensis]
MGVVSSRHQLRSSEELDSCSINKYELLKALDAFILSGKRFKEAASLLDIHPNTFAYRMKRIEEILDLRLEQHAVFFDLQFAWQVLDMLDLKQSLLDGQKNGSFSG